MQTEKSLLLSPDEILIRDNVRFSLKPYRVERLKEDILEAGGVRQPIVVEKLKEPIDGKEYALSEGRYRYEAVANLNSEQNAGLTLPARVVPEQNESDRLKRQVAENNERENMSPMDQAITIQKMISAGLSKMDIRKAFSVPGGKKGLKVAPASNSFINIRLGFLGFPKPIQKLIHDGIIGTNLAKDMLKKPKEDWEKYITAAQEAWNKEQDKQEEEEKKYLAETKKVEEAAQEHEKAAATLTEVQAKAESAKNLVAEKAEALTKATQEFISSKGEERKKATEHKRAIEQELKAAQQAADAAEKEAGKLEDKVKTASDKADAARKRLEEARAAKAAKKASAPAASNKAVATAVKKATGSKKLNAVEMRDCIKSLTTLSKPQAKYPKTIAVGALLEQAFDATISDGQLRLAIARLLGEEPEAKIPVTKK